LTKWSDNYAEWRDGRSIDPSKIDAADLAGRAPGAHRVIRGGNYWNGADWARSAYRGRDDPDVRDHDLGFRVVLSSPPPRAHDP
jgi:formylglycine-generating enzyme required for sulfatase activity